MTDEIKEVKTEPIIEEKKVTEYNSQLEQRVKELESKLATAEIEKRVTEIHSKWGEFQPTDSMNNDFLDGVKYAVNNFKSVEQHAVKAAEVQPITNKESKPKSIVIDEDDLIQNVGGQI